jgi:murein DD-endopeptidase MepM/ murein hydrolase activator NlpD
VMRGGELLTLPNSASYGTGGAALPGAAGQGGAIDVTTIAATALDRVPSNGAATGTAVPLTQPGAAPVRHLVKRGETAFQIARVYNVSARSLADWNGLGANLEVQEGQYLIIPTANGKPPVVNTNTAPGAGTPTPQPPSAKKPLPAETVAPASEKPKETPKSPDLVENRTEVSAAQFAMPVSGKIIRGYSKGKSDGIDIAAPVGTTVKAASSGTVAAITKNTSGTMIVVIKHADKLLTVYGGVDGLTVKKGDKVKRGQSIATVGAGSPSLLHFEVRQGVESLDPMTYLQ